MDSVRLLVNYGTHLFNSKGSLGENPFHAGVQCDSEEIASCYKNRKTICSEFLTPRCYTSSLCSQGRGGVLLIELLASKCSLRINDQDNKEETPPHYAVRSYRVDVVKALIKMGSCPNL